MRYLPALALGPGFGEMFRNALPHPSERLHSGLKRETAAVGNRSVPCVSVSEEPVRLQGWREHWFRRSRKSSRLHTLRNRMRATSRGWSARADRVDQSRFRDSESRNAD